MHVLDRDDAAEDVLESEYPENLSGIAARRIGQEHFPAGKAAYQGPETLFSMDHGRKIPELMRGPEKGFCTFAGGSADAEESRPELPPVLLAQDICLLKRQSGSCWPTVVGNPLIHVDADLGKDFSGCVVERIVEIEEPEHVPSYQ